MATPTTTVPAEVVKRSTSENQLTFPLTTIFTPDPACTWPVISYSSLVVQGSADGTTSVLKQGPTSCYPSQYYLTGDLVPLYSPGVCPSGWVIVSHFTS